MENCSARERDLVLTARVSLISLGRCDKVKLSHSMTTNTALETSSGHLRL